MVTRIDLPRLRALLHRAPNSSRSFRPPNTSSSTYPAR